MRYRCVPLNLSEANSVVSRLHRHHAPCVGHRFSLGAMNNDGQVIGVLIAGRPVSRKSDPSMTLEVSRVATDGSRNSCSFLLGAAARVAKHMGFAKIQTFTLPTEGGASLRGAGWVCEGLSKGGAWKRTNGEKRRTDQPTGLKHRWVKHLNEPVTYTVNQSGSDDNSQLALWGEA
jgi:hypothetical protein